MDCITIICLANSKKLGGHCVAGINLNTGEWVRAVRREGGALYNIDIKYKGGSFAKVLDIIEISVIEKDPLYFQPENWVIDTEKYWIKKGEFSVEDLERYCEDNDFIFYDGSDRLSPDKCKSVVDHSLILIKPKKIIFEKRNRIARAGTQIRANFNYNRHWYDLVVTDIEWENKFRNENVGIYEYDEKFFLTVSLGEYFEPTDSHFKLVASVIRNE